MAIMKSATTEKAFAEKDIYMLEKATPSRSFFLPVKWAYAVGSSVLIFSATSSNVLAFAAADFLRSAGGAGLSVRHGLGIQDLDSVPLRGDGVGVSELPAQPCAVEHGFYEEIACGRGRGIRRLAVGAERVGSGAPGRFRRRPGPY
ncbi:hypothetical protein ACFW6R_32375 [Streptomyces albidoflavus]